MKDTKHIKITFRFLAELVGKKERAVRAYYCRKGWKVRETEALKAYLKKYL